MTPKVSGPLSANRSTAVILAHDAPSSDGQTLGVAPPFPSQPSNYCRRSLPGSLVSDVLSDASVGDDPLDTGAQTGDTSERAKGSPPD